MRIENNVVVEIGAVVEAKLVGEGCLVEVNAKIGRRAVLGKVCFLLPNSHEIDWREEDGADKKQHCKIGPLCEVAEDEILPDYTVIYGYGMRRIDRSGVEELQTKMTAKQIDVQRRLIVNNIAKYQ